MTIFIWKSWPNERLTCGVSKRVELLAHLERMQSTAPLGRQVVRVLDYFAHQLLRTGDLMRVRDHAARDGEDGGEHAKVEDDGPALGQLELEERVRVEQAEEQQDGRERASDEGDEPRDDGRRRPRELRHVLLRRLVGAEEPLSEVVG